MSLFPNYAILNKSKLERMGQMDIKFDKVSDIPLYKQLADGIIKAIQSGELPINSMIPSERTLMETYDISRSTVRQAFDRLTKLGYLRKEHGRGSFIEMPCIEHQLGSFVDFKKEMNMLGKEAETKVLFFRIILCYPWLAPILRLTAKDYVFKFVRLHLADGEPLLLETTYLPYSRFEGLIRQDLERDSLHEIISTWYRTPITRSVESFEIYHLTPNEAEQLQCCPEDPAICKKRISFFGDIVVEHTVSITPNNRLIFRTVMEK